MNQQHALQYTALFRIECRFCTAQSFNDSPPPPVANYTAHICMADPEWSEIHGTSSPGSWISARNYTDKCISIFMCLCHSFFIFVFYSYSKCQVKQKPKPTEDLIESLPCGWELCTTVGDNPSHGTKCEMTRCAVARKIPPGKCAPRTAISHVI